MTRVLNVAHLQLGDTLVDNHAHYVVNHIEQDKFCYDIQLLDSTGGKINKCVPADQQVIIEL
jgi:protein-tyrosine phosphatase